MTVAIVLLALAGVLGLGLLVGIAAMFFFGSNVAVRYAAMRDSDNDTGLDDEPDSDVAEEDEVSRLDALAVQTLIQAAARIANNEDGWKVLPRPDLDAFSSALTAAEDRFADWIEWAQQVTDADASKSELAPAGTDA